MHGGRSFCVADEDSLSDEERGSAHAQVCATSMLAEQLQEPLSVPRKRLCVTSNNSRPRAEIWRERCLRETIEKKIKRGCSCPRGCVEKMSVGRIFEARCQNADRSSDELRAKTMRKLRLYRSSDGGKFSFKTEDNRSCCRVGYEVEQGVERSYITRCIQALEIGAMQGGPRGGKSLQ